MKTPLFVNNITEVWHRENREIKKLVSLSVMPSLYEDIQKIAHVQRRSISSVVGKLMEQYSAQHKKELVEYRKIKKSCVR